MDCDFLVSTPQRSKMLSTSTQLFMALHDARILLQDARAPNGAFQQPKGNWSEGSESLSSASQRSVMPSTSTSSVIGTRATGFTRFMGTATEYTVPRSASVLMFTCKVRRQPQQEAPADILNTPFSADTSPVNQASRTSAGV